MSALIAQIRRLQVPSAIILIGAFLICHSAAASLSAADEPRPSTEDAKIKELQKERLSTLQEAARLMNERFKSGVGTLQEVAQSVRMLYDAELELCGTDKDRVAVLEKQLAETKQIEKMAEQLGRSGQLSTNAMLLAKADRLQVEIALARAKIKVADKPAKGNPPQTSNDQVALAEKQIEIKRAAMQVAEAQKKLAIAKLISVKAQLAESQAAERFAEAQAKRMEELARNSAVSAEIVDEQHAKWEAAKARRLAAAGKVEEADGQIVLEQARIEQALKEVEDAELRVRQLKANQNLSGKD